MAAGNSLLVLQGLFHCLCGAISEEFSAIESSDTGKTWSEALLIYRIQSHTNPISRKWCLKRTGQKSSKEEPQECRKVPKRAQQACLKVQT